MNIFIAGAVGAFLAAVGVMGGVSTYAASQSTSAPSISSVPYADE